MSTPSIRRISYTAILFARNADELITAYAAECSIPGSVPQPQLYAAMEQAGALQCFGAYVDADLVGFVSVLSVTMPHNGKRMGTIESIFVTPSHRSTSAATLLMSAAEQYADELDCVGLIYQPRIGSSLDKILAHRDNCVPTHITYTRWL